jgi:hypothetical protein
MRTTFSLILAIMIIGACGSDSSPPGGDDDDMSPDGGTTAEPPDLKLVSPDIDIDPGQEVTYCWYFRTTNQKPLAIKHWQSTMTPGSHHLILYTSKTDVYPPPFLTTDCVGQGTGAGVWMYAAQNAVEELKLPADDGTGKPLAMEIGMNQSGFLQMHYNNRSDQVIKAHVEVSAYALAEGTAYTKTAAFVTYNDKINIPIGAVGDVETMSCNVPAANKFWLMTTHAHKRAVHTSVKDGATVVFESNDWEHPGAKQLAPFYQFSSGKLTYECTYNNTSSRVIMAGPSAQTDEMCMASGYFFPATRPVFCYNNIPIPL